MPDTRVTQCFNSNLVILSSWRQKDDVHGQEEINQIKINNGEPQETIGSSAPGKERLRTRKRVAMSLTHIFCYCWSNSSLTQRSVSKESVVCNTTENRGRPRGLMQRAQACALDRCGFASSLCAFLVTWPWAGYFPFWTSVFSRIKRGSRY